MPCVDACDGPDNVGACEAAQAEIIEAYEACAVDRADETSLGCEQYANTIYNCTDYFNGAANSAVCDEEGNVSWTYGEACF